jgi:hypothetical protein
MAASDRKFEIEDLIIRPGTYFNPQTEVMVVVDDSPSLDTEIFNLEDFEGSDWVLISDDLPVDEAQRDEMFERFQVAHHGGDGRDVPLEAADDEQDEETEEDNELEGVDAEEFE